MGDYNKDELDAPSWMNEAFFQDVLKKSEQNDSILVTELKITPATMKGDHFGSVMFRATIGYDSAESKENSKSVIIKTMPDVEGVKQELLGESYIFETEIGMYSETVLKLEAELRKAGDNTVLAAKALYYSLKPRKIIIFEDIVPKGYETIRGRLPDKTEAKGALEKLAKWHAVSYKLGVEGDQSVTKYRESLLNINNLEDLPFMTTGVENLIETLQQVDELKMYIPKLRLIQSDLLKRCTDSFNTYRHEEPKGIFVLCHGDFHGRNMMFKTNSSGQFEDVILLDFQFCYFGPAVLDVLYGIYMLLDEDTRLNHRDEMIYHYYAHFVETLEKLKFQGDYPKCADFMIEIINHRHWEIFLLSSFLPVFITLSSGKLEEDAEEVITSTDMHKKMYKNPKYINELKRLLPIMLQRGYLE